MADADEQRCRGERCREVKTRMCRGANVMEVQVQRRCRGAGADVQMCRLHMQQRCRGAEVLKRRCRGGTEMVKRWCRGAGTGTGAGAGIGAEVQRCAGARCRGAPQVQRCTSAEVQRCRGAECRVQRCRGAECRGADNVQCADVNVMEV